MNYLQLDLIDDHRADAVVYKATLIGIVVRVGEVPRTVACFTRGEGVRHSAVCLNEVGRCFIFCEHKSASHVGHLSRTSVLTITGNQLAELHERGVLRYGDSEIRLIEAP